MVTSQAAQPGSDTLICRPLQVIYKKFHVPCPLPPNFNNTTGNFSHMEVVKEKVQLQIEPEAAAFCTPSYFTLNSQVLTGQGGAGAQ